LGAASAKALSEIGYNVVLCDLNEEAGEATASSIGERAHFVKCNVVEEADVQEAVRVALSVGELRGAVSCAGIAPPAKVVGRKGPHSLELFRKVVEVNLIGSFNVMRLAADAMINETKADESGERGVLINTASIAAFEGQIGQAAYSASKGGIVGMTLPAARELARHGIRVMAIAPGLFNTPLLAGLPEAARDSLATQVPFPARLGEPEEFANVVRHIVENSYLNGSCIRLDGALRMQAR
jgi:NAD(P)-dependent dehydrogenase (short-subunit alcohol dehydrogenase family)